MRHYSSTYQSSPNRKCPQCGTTFHTFPYCIRQGRNKFCSRGCFTEAQNNARTARTINDFWDKVKKADNCWIWEGSHTVKGYGTLKIKKRVYYAHRIAYMLHYGDLPHGMLVCHHCDNPACVRPDHLFLGTSADNNRDMVRKGRNVLPPLTGRVAPKGEASLKAKLSNEQVIAIRASFAAGGISTLSLAKQFGIDPSHCSRIIHRQVWKHI